MDNVTQDLPGIYQFRRRDDQPIEYINLALVGAVGVSKDYLMARNHPEDKDVWRFEWLIGDGWHTSHVMPRAAAGQHARAIAEAISAMHALHGDMVQKLDDAKTLFGVIAIEADPDASHDLNQARAKLAEIQSRAKNAAAGHKSQWIEYWRGEHRNYGKLKQRVKELEAELAALKASV